MTGTLVFCVGFDAIGGLQQALDGPILKRPAGSLAGGLEIEPQAGLLGLIVSAGLDAHNRALPGPTAINQRGSLQNPSLQDHWPVAEIINNWPLLQNGV